MTPPTDRTDSRAYARRVVALFAGLALLLGAAGCGSDGGPSSSSSSAAPEVKPVSKVLHVTGKLPAQRQAATRKAIVARVDGWLRDAYLAGDYPRSAKSFRNAFPGFTPRAKSQARRQLGLMTNASVSSTVQSVTPVRELIGLDLLAPHGHIAGVSARVRLLYDVDGKPQGRFRVVGQLDFVPVKGRWKVFGFEVHRETVRPGEQHTRRQATKQKHPAAKPTKKPTKKATKKPTRKPAKSSTKGKG